MNEHDANTTPTRITSLLPLAGICCVWLIVLGAPSRPVDSDIARIVEIAHGGVPYVDQAVEYPPLQTAIIMVIGHWTTTVALVLTGLINAVATIACWRLLKRGWSHSVGDAFLWLALPIQCFMVFRLDAVAVALTVWGIVLARRGRSGAGGLAFGVAALLRLWPLVVLPTMWWRHRRAMAGAIVVSLIGVVIWLGLFGADAARQVITYRGATAWQTETPFGLVALARSGGRFFFEAGAARTGIMHGWQVNLLRLLTIATTAIAAWVARRRGIDPAGGPALAAVASLVLLSPVASPQYISWFLPWAAITTSERRDRYVNIAMIAAGVLASSTFLASWGGVFRLTAFLAAAGGRIVAIAFLALIGFTHRGEVGVAPRAATVDEPTSMLTVDE